MPSRSDLSGLRLFVTGAGSGIGRALLAMALADGAKVAALARDDAEAAALQAILPARQVLVRDLLADGPEDVASAAADRLDGLDGYAGCAGFSTTAPASTLTGRTGTERSTSTCPPGSCWRATRRAP